MSPDNDATSVSVTRRRVLTAGATAATTAVAGCASVGGLVGAAILEDVNVVNETDRRVAGSVAVVDPAGDAVLEETFELVPQGSAEADNDDRNSAAVYEDVWTEAGTYEIRVGLTNTAIESTSRASETVAIDDPGSEMVGVTLGAESGGPILVRAGDDPADISDPADVAEETG